MADLALSSRGVLVPPVDPGRTDRGNHERQVDQHLPRDLIVVGPQTFMNPLGGLIEEIAALGAATFCSRLPQSSLPSEDRFSEAASISMRETKFSYPLTMTGMPPTSAMSISDSTGRIRSVSLRPNTSGKY